jgi:esterase/lipase
MHVDAMGVVVVSTVLREMLNVSRSGDKELKEFKGSSHQLLTDPGWEPILEHIVNWIEKRAHPGVEI